MYKIILVDDNKTFRDGLRFMIGKIKGCDLIAEYSDGLEFINSELLQEADLVLMDLEMPQIGGVEAARKVLWNNTHLKIIAITMYTDKAYLLTLLEAGFKGGIFKDHLFQDLEKAITTVMEGKFYFPSNITLKSKE